MPRGYGNWSDPVEKVDDNNAVDQPHPRRSITQKILATLPPGNRDTPHNRRMAKANGWSDERFQEWVEGDADDESIRDG